MLFFTSNRPGGLGSNDLYAATRTVAGADFAPPYALAAPVNSQWSDAQPFLRADGAELWFASDRPGGAGAHDIYRAPIVADLVGPPTRVAEVSKAFDDFTPTISGDGLLLFFASSRVDVGALGAEDVWAASRARPTDPFSNVHIVPELSSAARDFPAWLSADGCRLYMSSTRPGAGSEDIYLAMRGN